jgi:hypothetical protein
MTTEVNIITQWIPVVGTLLGTSIGFAASFFTSRYNKVKDEVSSRENRDRERVEKIYQLLVKINSERAQEMGEAINSIHHATPIKDKDLQGFPPLLELEMLIKLYLPSLESQRLELIVIVQTFGKKYFEFRFKDYKKESLEKRQKDSGVLVNLSLKIDDQVKLMQKNLVNHVKA